MLKTRIAIDLDGTMLDTVALWRAALNSLNIPGVDWQRFLELKEIEYGDTLEKGHRVYSLNRHLAVIKNERHFILETRESIFDFFRDNVSKFFFKDAIYFLDTHHKDKELVLLTYCDGHGQKNIQKAKIDGIKKSGLGDCFKNIIITSKEKGRSATTIFKNDAIYLNVFIDNSADQINSVSGANPFVSTIWMDRNKQRNKNSLAPNFDLRVKNFNQVDDFLSKF